MIIDNMQIKFGEVWMCGSWEIQTKCNPA